MGIHLVEVPEITGQFWWLKHLKLLIDWQTVVLFAHFTLLPDAQFWMQLLCVCLQTFEPVYSVGCGTKLWWDTLHGGGRQIPKWSVAALSFWHTITSSASERTEPPVGPKNSQLKGQSGMSFCLHLYVPGSALQSARPLHL